MTAARAAPQGNSATMRRSPLVGRRFLAVKENQMNLDITGRRKPGAKRAKKMSAFTYALLINLLMEGTRTCRELAEETGLHILTIYDYTYHLHKAKALFIVGWDGEGRNQTRIFMLGRGKDVPRPSKSRKQISEDYRVRQAAKALLHRMAGDVNEMHV